LLEPPWFIDDEPPLLVPLPLPPGGLDELDEQLAVINAKTPLNTPARSTCSDRLFIEGEVSDF
jgi:hypothetical protein